MIAPQVAPAEAAPAPDITEGQGGNGDGAPPPQPGNGGGGNGGGATGVAGAAGAPITWENLKNQANLAPHEVGYALALKHADVPWTDVLAPFREVAALEANYNAQNLVRQYGNSIALRYFLVVVSNEVEVLYGLRPCHAVAGSGQRYLALLGE